MRTARPGGPSGNGLEASDTKVDADRSIDAFSASLQIRPRAEATLDRIARYRTALNCWHDRPAGLMPQPRDHGINLPDLDPAQVLWGGRP